MQKFKLLGVNVHSISPEEAYDYVLNSSQLDKTSHIVFLDTYLLIKSQFNKELFNFINNASLVIPISPGIKIGLKFLNRKLEKVYNYFNFIINLLIKYTDKKEFIYILGGNRSIIEKAERNIRDSYPGIRLVGRFHIDYKKDFEKDLITAIQKASPALILVGKKSPSQEKWIYKKEHYFKKGVFLGVKDFFEIVGGKKKSPTDEMVQSGFYRLFNLFKNPFRLFRIFYYIIYIFLLLLSKISRSHYYYN